MALCDIEFAVQQALGGVRVGIQNDGGEMQLMGALCYIVSGGTLRKKKCRAKNNRGDCRPG
jgi:hypothetical protein